MNEHRSCDLAPDRWHHCSTLESRILKKYGRLCVCALVYKSACVCLCACVRECVRACTSTQNCVCVHACLCANYCTQY